MKRFFVLVCVCCMFLVTVIGCRRPPREANAVGGDNYNDGVSHDSYPNTQPIQPTEEYHIYGAWRANYDGVTHSRECACGEIETNTHNFASASVTREPTHISEGEKTYVCVDCGATKTESIPAQMDEHSYGIWVADSNSDTHSRKCDCGKQESANHRFSSAEITREPTHTSEGINTYVCLDCGAKKTESVAAKINEHTYGLWGQYDCTYHIRYCACGAEETEMHSFDSGTIVAEATCTTSGLIIYTCLDCGAVQKETIPPLVVPGGETGGGFGETVEREVELLCGNCGYSVGSQQLTVYNGLPAEITWTCPSCGIFNRKTVTVKW